MIESSFQVVIRCLTTKIIVEKIFSDFEGEFRYLNTGLISDIPVKMTFSCLDIPESCHMIRLIKLNLSTYERILIVTTGN